MAQNVGYMIPGPVINRFLEDIKDGTYDHYVDLAVADFPLENPAMRRALGLKENGMGVLVAHVDSVRHLRRSAEARRRAARRSTASRSPATDSSSSTASA